MEQRKYDPFGQRKSHLNPALPFTGSTSHVRQGFTGHEHDELGLLNMRGRMYDPKLGRFLTPDPLVQAPFSSQALNRYSYVLNNPLSPVDPSGFQAVVAGERWCLEEGLARMAEQADEPHPFPTAPTTSPWGELPWRRVGPSRPRHPGY